MTPANLTKYRLLKPGRFLFLLLAFALIFPNTFFGQSLPFRKYTVEDGLPENRVMGITEDSHGFLWLISRNGLTRFDGIEMLGFKVEDTESSLLVKVLVETINKEIWGITTKGVARYDGEEFHLISLPVNRSYKELFPSMEIGADNSLWLWAKDTTGSDLIINFKDSVYSPWSSEQTFLEGKTVQDIIYIPKIDETWIVIDKLVYRIGKNGPEKISDVIAIDVFYAGDEIYALGADYLPLHFDGNDFIQFEPGPLSEKLMKSPFFDRLPGEKLIIYAIDGTNVFDWPFGHVNGVYQDSDNTTWIASEDGLYRVLSESFYYIDQIHNLLPGIWSVTQDNKGNMWFASIFGTLQRFDGQNVKTISVPENIKPTNYTIGAYTLADGRILFPTYDGILQWDGDNFSKLDILSGQSEVIYEDVESGTILIGAVEGLVKIKDGRTEKFKKAASPGELGYVKSICKDSNGFFWLATEKSVVRFDGEIFYPLKPENNPPSDAMSIACDSSGRIWIGGESGLAWYDELKEIFVDALPSEKNDPVRFIRIIDRSRIIVGRSGDFIILNLDKWAKGEQHCYYIYNKYNGFMTAGCIQNGITRDSDGNFWIIGNDRIVKFNPDHEQDSRKAPILYITAMDVLNGNLNWVRKFNINPYSEVKDRKFDLKHKENNIRFHMRAISTHNPESIMFKYRIIGNDTTWSQPTYDNQVIIAGTKPGKYLFQAISCNAEGVWNDSPSEIEITIKPVYWQTLVFKIVFLIIMLASGHFISDLVIRLRKARKEERIRTMREYFKLQMGNFVQQFDPHFTFNILTAVSELIYNGHKETANEYLIKFSNLLRRVIIEDKFTRRLDEELDFVREYCEMQKLKMRDRLKYNITVSDPEANELTIPRMVVHNFVENAIKWGIGPKQEGGTIEIIVSGTDQVTITVTDDGIGREAASKKAIKGTGTGLRVITELIDMLNRYNREKIVLEIKEVKGENGECSGTRVDLTIPVRYNYFTSNHTT